jgi:hypothetical protein
MERSKNKELIIFRVDSVDELQRAVEDARELLNLCHDEELWFRGVSSRKHELLPSLQRLYTSKKPPKSRLRHLEQDLFFEFLAKARTTEGSSLDHWDALFLMQHYRAPTRLLDWTEVLYVALYFAVNYLTPDEESNSPRIYVMNPYLWNKEHTGSRDLYFPRYFGWDSDEEYYYEYGELLLESDGIDWEPPIALYPPQRDARLSAQHGYFTIHGNDSRPLETISPQLLIAIDLSPDAVSSASNALKHSGMNEYSLFPDLEGLARHLRAKYGLPVPYPRY